MKEIIAISIEKIPIMNVDIDGRFKFTEKGIWWVKLYHQGMNDQMVYCRTEQKYRQRNMSYNYKYKLVNEMKGVFVFNY